VFAAPALGFDSPLLPVARVGYLGVDFFFVLSGFILAVTHASDFGKGREGSAVRFWLTRLARIYPLHVFMMGVVLALIVGGRLVFGFVPAHSGNLSPELTVANLLLIQSWGFFPPSWNEPSWSISCEWFAYLWFPAIAAVLGSVSRTSTRWIVCFFPLAAMIIALRLLGAPNTDETVRFGLIRISGEFLSGFGAFLIWQRADSPRMSRVFAIGAATVLATALTFRQIDPLVVFSFPLFILALVTNPSSALAQALSSRRMLVLGELSYAIYMVNQRIILAVNRLFHFDRLVGSHWSVHVVVTIALGAAVVAAAYVVHQRIEVPCRRYGRELIERWFTARAADPAAL
jgi:peptidoglycan/LPS O-acetylase OafA/YrhL